MSNTNITFTARLRDYLTGPAQKAAKSVEDLGKATDKAAGAAGRYTDAQGRLREANGRFVSSSTKARESTERQAKSLSRVIGATSKMDSMLRRVSGTAEGSGSRMDRALSRVGRSMDRLGNSTGPGRFVSGMTTMANGAEGAARRIESAMGRVAKGVALAGGALAGGSLAGGLSRLNALESLDVKLQVMGYDEAGKERIGATTLDAVTGTPFGLGEASTATGMLLGAGVTQDQLGERLGTVVDTAAAYSMPLEQTARVFSQVQAKGRLQGDEALQLAEAGFNVNGTLAKHLGVEQADVPKLITEGKVTADEFFAAVAPAVAGGADLMGETFMGKWSNFKAALARGGAGFLAPVLGPLGDGLAKVGAILDSTGPAFTRAGEALASGIAGASEHLPALVNALEPLGGALLNLFEAGAGALPGLMAGFVIWGGILAQVLAPLANVAAFLLDYISPALPVLVPLVLGLGAGFTTWRVLKFVAPLIGTAGKALMLLGRVIMAHPILWIPLAIYTAAKALKWLYDNVEPVRNAFDWLADSMDRVFDTFDRLGDKIDLLVQEKLPALHTALTFGSGSTVSDDRDWGTRLTDYASNTGERWELPDLSGGGRAEKAERYRQRGFFTGGRTGGASPYEERGVVHGQEFVVDHWATSKLDSDHPGALDVIGQGKLPAVGVPVPVGAGGGGSSPVVFNQNFTLGAGADANTAREFAAQWKREMAAYAREVRMTNSTLTARGAH